MPREKSHYQVGYCCVVDSEGNAKEFREQAAYHGQMFVDPATGAILRLLIEAETKPGQPVSRAAILVEYGPVDIGGRTYICPVRSLALSRAESVIKDKDILVPAVPRAGPQAAPAAVAHSTSYTPGPEHTLLNDTAFSSYHVFRSDARIVAQNEANALGNAPATPAPRAEDANTAAAPQPSTAAGIDAAAAARKHARPPPVSAVAGAAPPVPPASTPDAAIPEVSVTSFAPGDASGMLARPDAAYTLRTTTRSVDIGVVVLDKKGNRVTNLKQEDFAIEDNGAPQTMRSFVPAGGGTPRRKWQRGSVAAAPVVSLAADAGEFSNVSPAPNRARAETGNTTILMIDAANLAFGDLNYARQEMLQFLKTLAPGEPVGLFVMKRSWLQGCACANHRCESGRRRH